MVLAQAVVECVWRVSFALRVPSGGPSRPSGRSQARAFASASAGAVQPSPVSPVASRLSSTASVVYLQSTSLLSAFTRVRYTLRSVNRRHGVTAGRAALEQCYYCHQRNVTT